VGRRNSFLDVNEEEAGWCWGWHGVDGVLMEYCVVEDEGKEWRMSGEAEIITAF